MSATPIAVFASGRGSNWDAILGAVTSGRLAAEVRVLVCDQPGAPVLEKAKKAGIPAVLVPFPEKKAGQSLDERRKIHDQAILEMLKPYAPRFLVLAGYMKLMSPLLLQAFRSERGYSRIVNIHPSLLPAFPGTESYRQAYLYGCKMSGVTVHLVELEMDQGPICAQEAFAIGDCQSVAQVEERGLAIEHRLFVETLAWVLPEKFVAEPREGRLSVCPN